MTIDRNEVVDAFRRVAKAWSSGGDRRAERMVENLIPAVQRELAANDVAAPIVTVAGLAEKLLNVASRVEALLTAWGDSDERESRDKIAGELRALAALASPAPSAGAGVDRYSIIVQSEKPYAQAYFDPNGEWCLFNEVRALQHPAAPSVSPAVAGDAGELPEEIEAIVCPLEDDAAGMLEREPQDGTALNMQAAAALIRRLATAEQPGSAVQGEAVSVYAALRSIRYNATHGSQDRPMHVRLSLIAGEANKAIAAIEATTPPPAAAPRVEEGHVIPQWEIDLWAAEDRMRGIHGTSVVNGERRITEDGLRLLAASHRGGLVRDMPKGSKAGCSCCGETSARIITIEGLPVCEGCWTGITMDATPGASEDNATSAPAADHIVDANKKVAPAAEQGATVAFDFCWLVELFRPYGGNSLGRYYTGRDADPTATDPYKAQRYATVKDAQYAATLLVPGPDEEWRGVEHGFQRPATQPEARGVEGMVNRFLCWKLPDDFAPDAGVSFTPGPHQSPGNLHWPIGTNLLTAVQAREMFEHCLAGIPSAPAGAEWKPITEAQPPAGRMDLWLVSDDNGDYLVLARRSSQGWRVDGVGDELPFTPTQYCKPPMPDALTPPAAPRAEGYIKPSGERCRCDCHRDPNVRHIAPCCYPTATLVGKDDAIMASGYKPPHGGRPG